MGIYSLTRENHLESLDGFLERHKLARRSCEDLGDLEGLAEETLDLSGASNSQLVILGQLVHSQDGNDVL